MDRAEDNYLGMSSLPDDENHKIKLIADYMELDDLLDDAFVSQKEEDDWAKGLLDGLSRDNSTGLPDSVPAVVTSEKPKKKAVRWTTEEHKLFLLGLELLGRGRWKAMSKFFVPTRTPVEIASHAQKYYQRAKSTKPKKRNSVNDAVLSAEDRITLMDRVVLRLGAQGYRLRQGICPLQGFTAPAPKPLIPQAAPAPQPLIPQARMFQSHTHSGQGISPLQGFTAPAPQPLIPHARMFQSHTHSGQAQAMPAPRMTPYFPMNGYNGASMWMPLLPPPPPPPM